MFYKTDFENRKIHSAVACRVTANNTVCYRSIY